MVVVEASASGVPVIASDVGHSDIIQHGQTGTLLPPDDGEAWLKTLRSFFANRVLSLIWLVGPERIWRSVFISDIPYRSYCLPGNLYIADLWVNYCTFFKSKKFLWEDLRAE